jgi:hypothetical protein
MKKILLLCLSILLLLFSAYTLGVLIVGGIFLKPAVSILHLILPCLLFSLVLCGIVLCIVCFGKHRIGRFNSDIFTTIILFLVFMLSFTVHNDLVFRLVSLNTWFPVIGELVHKLSLSGIGIYEATLALATLCCGLTIGEGRQKKYYE